MKKEPEQEEVLNEPQGEPDVIGMLKKIQQHLVFLEKKIDILMEKAPEPSRERQPRHFSEHRKPFGRPFHHNRGEFRGRPGGAGGGFHHGRREEQGRPFERQGNEQRPFERPPHSEGERSFQARGRFSRHRKGPRRPF